MQSYDNQMAQRVWQRVRGNEVPEHDAAALAVMIAGEWADATTYLHLSRKFQNREAAMLRQLFEQEQSHCACLKGIYTLLTSQRISTQTVPAPQEPVEVTLRRCYGREMQCLAQYEQWASHREYGIVFSRLAQQEQEHCRILLELLGTHKR